MFEHVRVQYVSVPVIAMAAELKKIKVMEQGAHDYLLKPIDVDLLAKKCCTVFGSRYAYGDGEISSLPQVELS